MESEEVEEPAEGGKTEGAESELYEEEAPEVVELSPQELEHFILKSEIWDALAFGGMSLDQAREILKGMVIAEPKSESQPRRGRKGRREVSS